MSKVEHNGIYYDPNNEIVCDKRTLNNLIVENEHYKKKIADLEAKLAEAQKTIEIQKMSNDALQEENLDYRYDITDTAYEQAKEMASNWESQYQEEIKELKAKLAEYEAIMKKHNIVGITKLNDCLTDYLDVKEETLSGKIIKQLKQQLAEKDKAIENWQTMYQSVMQSCHNGIEEDKRLREQLAEKDEETEKWKSMAERSSSILDRFNYCGESIIYNTTREQDKISFVVAELEKAKIEFETYYADNIWNYPQYLEDRIAELTHQHEDKGE